MTPAIVPFATLFGALLLNRVFTILDRKDGTADYFSKLVPEATSAPQYVKIGDLTEEQANLMYQAPSQSTKAGQKELHSLLEFYGDYNITMEQTKGFHPVVKFPHVIDETAERRPFYFVKDLTNYSDTMLETATTLEGAHTEDSLLTYAVGKYNEVRANLYTSDLFLQDSSGTLDGRRIVHTGIDLYGPVNTPVHAFADGRISSFGYNPAEGDYGHVVVVQHWVGEPLRSIWALYGHLSAKSIENKRVGGPVARGQRIGFMGNSSENGGWPSIHVHFQLSVSEPPTHDMPGAVTLGDRSKALRDYPDPRIVLGMLYEDPK